MDLPKTFDNGLVLEAYTGAPSWANQEHTAILLMLKFAHLQEFVPYGASPADPEVHGREIFDAAWRGEFGEVQPFVVTPAMGQAMVTSRTEEATQKINELQEEVNVLQDSVDLEMASDAEIARLAAAKAELTAWKRYRVLLSRVPSQPGFPTTIEWPVKPA